MSNWEKPKFIGTAFHNGSQVPPKPSKWETEPVTELGPDDSFASQLVPEIKRNTEVAARYSQAYHTKDYDAIVRLCAPTCQFGTFFGFVWGPTAVRIALMEEQSMYLKFVGKVLTYSSKPGGPLPRDSNEKIGDASSIRQAWYGASDVGLHKGPGAPAFFRVNENIFERDGVASRTHRPFPWNVWDYFVQNKVRETLVVADGQIQCRVLQNIQAFMPLPYDFM